MVDGAYTITRQIIRAFQVVLAGDRARINVMRGETVKAERTHQLEIPGDLHLVDHVARVIGRQRVVARYHGEARSRHAARTRIYETGVAGKIGSRPGWHAEIGARLIAGFTAQLDAGGQRVIDNPGIELAREIGRIHRKSGVGFAFTAFPADGHEIKGVPDARTTCSSGEAADERLHGSIGEPTRRRVAAEAIVDQHTRPVRDLEIVAKVLLDDAGKNMRL